MIKVDETNYQLTKQFIIDNLDRSGFTYGNLDLEDTTSYIKVVNGRIVAMTNLIPNSNCTYMFPESTSEPIIREVINFMSDKPHSGGTVIGEYSQILKDYYELPDNAINEVATLMVTENNYKSYQAEYLTSADVEIYKTARDTIVEFQPQTIDKVADMFLRTKVVGIKSEGKIISAASLSAISDVNAVVTGVFTVKEHEGKGLAKDCVLKLLEDYATNRTITIFFTNPIAKQLYLNLGFKVDDKLIMYNNH